MPGFKTNTQVIVFLVAKVDISETHELFEYARFCETFGKIGCTKIDLTDIEVTDAYVDGNLVTAPAWPAHPAWMAKFLAVLGTKIEL